ncbi:MAG: P-loop NTPase [Elusimicrobia bacterium]|nr:P-loop NTPase [Elusimicrobiota bacterium]
MREILVISGKGGTGKTTVTASLSRLFDRIVLCDCDVDAPDLHLLLKPRKEERFEFIGGGKAKIDGEKCTKCGRCVEVCEFDAVSDSFVVDEISCEGCGVCVWNCPVGAIEFKDAVSGEYFVSEIKNGRMVHAQLFPGEENSGKLVTEVKRKAREVAEKEGILDILVDGPPGVGCPVMASMGNVSKAIIVTEPTVSGLHDMKRILNLCEQFKVGADVVINKAGLNSKKTDEIRKFCREKGIEVLLEIPFSREVNQALSASAPIVEYRPEGKVAKAIKELAGKIRRR